MQLTPYPVFDGNCAEAFALYARLFGGTILHQATYAEMPAVEGMPAIPESAKDRIMLMHLQIGEHALMGSDAMPGADAGCGGTYQVPQGLWISISTSGPGEGRRLFDALAEGGQIVMPFAPTFFSSGFGMVRDRFGTPWMINVAETA